MIETPFRAAYNCSRDPFLTPQEQGIAHRMARVFDQWTRALEGDEPQDPMSQEYLIWEQLQILGWDDRLSSEEFFWRYLIVETPECKPWPYGDDPRYGLIHLDNLTAPHRAACVEKWGHPKFPELVAAHRCRNLVRCWNGAHLEWKPQHENCREDMYRDGTMVLGERRWNSKLTEVQVLDIRAQIAAGRGYKPVAAQHGISSEHVRDLVERRYWKHI